MTLATRLGRALRGLLESDPVSGDSLLQQVQGLRAEMDAMHSPTPDGWESCAGMNTAGICTRYVPISGHIVGGDGDWWHAKTEPRP